MEPRRVLVALSGGIDSAAVVLMLLDKGYAVQGLYIDMLGSVDACEAAKGLAQRLGIELHVENVVDEFRAKIINHTLAEHQAGRTPSPCVRCNPLIKWAVAVRVADRLGIRFIATGHYVRIVDSVLYRGVDPAKDQSYYLWDLPSEILSRAITPLGEMTKAEVREYLSAHDGFEQLARGGESMSVCFVGRGGYSSFLGANLSVRQGEVVDQAGRPLGYHSGFQLYTVGQRRGFTGGGVIVGVDPDSNRVITSEESGALFSGTIELSSWVLAEVDPASERVDVMVRGIGRNPSSGVRRIERLEDGRLRVELNESDAWAVAVGQPVVFYIGDRVIGGGIAESAQIG